MNTEIKKSAAFLAATFIIGWILLAAVIKFHPKLHNAEILLIGFAYAFLPMIVAVIMQKAIYMEQIKEPLGISFKLNWWYLVAWLSPVILAFAALAVSLFFPDVEFATGKTEFIDRLQFLFSESQINKMKQQIEVLPLHPVFYALMHGMTVGITINALFAFGEEVAWRGFLFGKLLQKGFFKMSFIIGFFWGLWHIPMALQGYNYSSNIIAGIFMTVFWYILLSPIISYIRLKSGSILATAIFVGTLNSTYRMPLILLKGGSEFHIGLTGFAGFIILAITNLAIYVYENVPDDNEIRESGSGPSAG